MHTKTSLKICKRLRHSVDWWISFPPLIKNTYPVWQMLFLASFFFSEARKYPHFVNRDGTELSDSRERPRGSGSDPTRSDCSANTGPFLLNQFQRKQDSKEMDQGESAWPIVPFSYICIIEKIGFFPFCLALSFENDAM